jgi:hypothetical protein
MQDYLVQAIKSLRPSAEFSYTDGEYSTIHWDVLKGDAPTKAEIDAEIAKIKDNEVTEAQNKASARAALLDRLGLTADEAVLLLG